MIQNLFPELQQKRIKISAAWANKVIACCMPYIATNCGGGCCKSKSFYPAKSNNGVCFHLGEFGCKLKPENRPTICLLYPFVIKNNTIVLHGRALTSVCKKNYKIGDKTIYEQNKRNLVILFGEDQYNRVLKDLLISKDSYFNVEDSFYKQLEIESEWEEKNIIPPPTYR